MKPAWYDFVKDLKDFEKKVRNKVIRDAQKAALKPLASAIKQVAPVDTGELEAGIKTKAGKRKKDVLQTVVEIRTPDDNPHAARVEFGTLHNPAEPFIRPTVLKMKPQIIDTMVEHLNQAIDEIKGQR